METILRWVSAGEATSTVRLALRMIFRSSARDAVLAASASFNETGCRFDATLDLASGSSVCDLSDWVWGLAATDWFSLEPVLSQPKRPNKAILRSRRAV